MAGKSSKRSSGEGKRPAQRVMHCRCERTAIRARGQCASCYMLRAQDRQYFGGLREAVLKRDGYRCRVCGRLGRGKWSIVVHHRVPGVSELDRMIALCPRHHGIVERTEVALAEMPALLLELWRERHPGAHEQRWLDFRAPRPAAAAAVSLFGGSGADPQSEGYSAAAFVGRSSAFLSGADSQTSFLRELPGGLGRASRAAFLMTEAEASPTKDK